jgi:hypothetical protein
VFALISVSTWVFEPSISAWVGGLGLAWRGFLQGVFTQISTWTKCLHRSQWIEGGGDVACESLEGRNEEEKINEEREKKRLK